MRLSLKYKLARALAAFLVPAAVACACLTPGANTQDAIDAGARSPSATAQSEARPGGPPAESRVRGRVAYADSRRPLRRAEVTLVEAETGALKGSAITDRRGEFLFENVAAGRYLVVAEAPDIVSPRTLAGRRGSLAAKIALGEIEDGFAEVAVGVKHTVEAEVRVRRGGAITGGVSAEDGEPVAGADVKLFRRERDQLLPFEPTWLTLEREKRALRTDSRGVYRIAGLPSGEYVVRVSEGEVGTDQTGDEDAAYADGSLVVAYHPAASNLKDAQPVTVREGSDSAGIDVRMPERMTYKIAGAVSFGRGDAPGGFTEIKIDRKDEGTRRRSSLDVRTRADAEGRWELRGVPDGEYVVTIRGSVRVSSREDGGWVSAAPRRLDVRVAGADIIGLKVRLSPGARVSGTVAVEGGLQLPADLLRVELVSAAEGGKAKLAGGAEVETVGFTFVQGDGEFSLNELPAGRYYLRASGEPGASFYVKSIIHKGIDLLRSPLKLEAGASVEGVRVTLSPDVATVSGRAVTAAGGTLSPGAAVVLIPADMLTRRSDGDFPLTRADHLGRFTVKCAPGDYFVVGLARRRGNAGRPPLDETFLTKNRAKLRRVTLRPGEELTAIEVAATHD